MKRNISKYLILAIGIFTADIVKEFVLNYTHDYLFQKNPFFATFVRMLVSIAVFYPIFLFLEEYTKEFSKKYVSTTKNVFGGGFQASLIAGLIGLGLVYFTFLWLWYKINIVKWLF